ncbi:MAG: glycosyltransferase [Ignavibacteria bacterium]|jgi:hypothetical protein|nr:glycosyltransferase [Ignavibacteria bacterium]MCU7512008.1 glycosyltransferase [Ignavibacteria bacterium]
MINLAPIALFVYNRPVHTSETLKALKENVYAAESELFVFSDGPRSSKDIPQVNEVREIVKKISGFKNITIIEQKENLGLANSIISGVTKLCNKYGKVIVLEDDLISSPYFLKYMNEGLNYYEGYKNVFTVCGFNHNPGIMKINKDYAFDVFFSYRNSSYGWGTWRDRWERADWELPDYNEFMLDKKKQKLFNKSGDDLTNLLVKQVKGRIDSWSIRWTYSHFKNNALAVYPRFSYIDNIGFDGSGVHCKPIYKYNNDLSKSIIDPTFVPPFTDEKVLEAFRNIYKYSLIKKAKRYIAVNLLEK